MLDAGAVFENNLPFWKGLTQSEQALIKQKAIIKKLQKNEILFSGDSECLGLIIVGQGQLRAFMISEEGKEISLYRLLSGDACIMAASCILKSITFEISIEAEKESEIAIIPSNIYETLSNENLLIKQYTLELVSMRFSEVMLVMEQLVFSSLGKRLAGFLLEQSTLEDSKEIAMTHEAIARNLGSAREVITRLLKQFHEDGMVNISRNSIEIMDMKRLQMMAR